jgi:hypothetical protein
MRLSIGAQVASERIPLVGSIINRNTDATTLPNVGQKWTNCYPEVTQNAVTGQASVTINKRPGYTGTNNAPANYGGLGGCVMWSGKSKAVFPYVNGTSLGFYDSELAQVGNTLTDLSRPQLTETTYLGLPTLTVMVYDSGDSLRHVYYIKDGDATWTEITDVDFPVNQTPQIELVGRMVHMDGYAFVMDISGKVWNSDLNNITSWSASGFLSAQTSPDGGSGLAITKNLLVAFGSGSIEFFQNTGNVTGSPLTRIASAAINIGSTRNGFGFNPSHLEVGDSVYFFSTQLDSAQVGVYQLTGTQLQKISNAAIDKIVQDRGLEEQLGFAGTFKAHGMMHIMLYTGDNINVPCYCLETRQWWYWECGEDNAIRACVDQGRYSFLTGSSRKRYLIDSSSPVYTDDGSAMTMEIQTNPIDHGTRRRKFYTSLEIIGDIRSTSGNTSVSWSDDDYQSFSTARTVNMSDVPPVRSRLTRLGSGRRRAWRIQDAVNAPFRAESIDLEFDVGTT